MENFKQQLIEEIHMTEACIDAILEFSKKDIMVKTTEIVKSMTKEQRQYFDKLMKRLENLKDIKAGFLALEAEFVQLMLNR